MEAYTGTMDDTRTTEIPTDTWKRVVNALTFFHTIESDEDNVIDEMLFLMADAWDAVRDFQSRTAD